MTIERNSAGSRHRGEHRDPVGAVLTGFWALGHVVTVLLLGTSTAHQLDPDHLGPMRTPQSAPDREPPT
ncbi:hypothetical protein ACFY00_05745 [Kitasatospora sp. NPDC001540]|uniref:hypothetical protein n=1 Tax=Kitasatospora sp. NPDC001540 TaxID=3364014 RepID=UPI0036A19F28